MKTLRIAFVERRLDFPFFASIEKVFRIISDGFDLSRFRVTFQQLMHSNTLLGTLQNLLFYRPTKNADIYHVTGHCHYIALRLPPERTVLTIHDAGILHIRTGLRRWVLKKLLIEMPLRRLRYVTAISQATKDEIAANFGRLAEKIRVIENPVDDSMRADSHKEFCTERPRILQIGSLPNKNAENVIRALKGIDCRLSIIGVLGPEQKRLLTEKGIDFESRSQLSDGEMIREYRQADILVFCSTLEGFGLPIIEAQAARLPVVTSDLSPMKEVAGAGGAVLVDPFDHRSIRAGIERVIREPELRSELVEQGIKNIERFDKKVIAAQYAALYEEIAKDLGETTRR